MRPATVPWCLPGRVWATLVTCTVSAERRGRAGLSIARQPTAARCIVRRMGGRAG